jgi:iron complex transport system substrate-binding protein
VVHIPDAFTGQGIVQKIRLIADVTGTAARGECLVRAVEGDLAALDTLRSRIDQPLQVTFVLSFLSGRAQVAGRGTAADGIIRLSGAVNAISEYDGYKAINDEAIIAARPDFVLAMQQGAAPLDAGTVFAHPGFALTPAAARQAFLAMNGLYLLGFGPRTALAARDLAATLYPSLRVGKLPSETGAASVDACNG